MAETPVKYVTLQSVQQPGQTEMDSPVEEVRECAMLQKYAAHKAALQILNYQENNHVHYVNTAQDQVILAHIWDLEAIHMESVHSQQIQEVA